MIIRAGVALHTMLVPYHFGSPRHGTGAGPEALASNGVLNGLPVSGATTITVESQAWNEIQQCIAIDAAVAAATRKACEGGETPVVFSGNCHACLGSLAGIGSPAAIVWFDAHGDINTPETTETGYFDGMALATALGWCWTNLTRQIPGFAAAQERDVLLAGGRDLDRGERVRLRRSNLRHYLPPALAGGRDAAFATAVAVGGTARRAYIHLDLDVIDPSELWANQFKVPGGVSVAWLEAALGDVRAHYEIACFGVSAYDPSFTPPAVAAPIVNRLLKAVMGHTTA
jgi:arginase